MGARIGRGGMADVFAGQLVGAEERGRDVAIKVMHPPLTDDPAVSALLVREAELAAQLDHPNIASVLEVTRDRDGRHVLIMERIAGVTLRALMNTGRVPIPHAIQIIAGVLRGLGYAHELTESRDRVIHRDVSPTNVMLSWRGAVKLVDFGLARPLPMGELCSEPGFAIRGRPGYLSPEQACGAAVDHRTDLFSTGVVLYELLTGRPLFTSADPARALAKLQCKRIASPRLRRPEVSESLAAVCMRLLERDRPLRYQRAGDALTDLIACPDCHEARRPALDRLLRDRFPDRTPPLDRHAPAALQDAAPDELQDAAPAALMHAVTRTALPLATDRTAAQLATRRAVLWIGGALLISIAAIALTLLVT